MLSSDREQPLGPTQQGPARVEVRRTAMRILGRLSAGVLAAAVCFAGATGTAGARDTHQRPRHRASDIKWLPQLSNGIRHIGPDTTFAGPYVTWDWPDAGYSDIEERLTISRRTTSDSHLFYAHQFGFVGGDGGYIGLQEGSNTGSKIVLFSIWSANGTSGRNCGHFSGEGTGRTCRIDPYDWKPGRTYELEVQLAGADDKGTWYVATVLDTVTGSKQVVGSIRVPGAWGGVQGWVSWTEYFGGSVARCTDLPRSRVLWGFPTAEHGTVKSTGHEDIVNEGDCQAKVTDVPNGVLQIIRF
jgi:hypothetical protein